MTLHLIKLCVGVDTLEELARGQARRIAALKKKRAKLELIHVTRQTPKRAPELLDGGSLYWVVKGQIAARQKLLDIREVRRRDGPPRCGLVYGPELVPTLRRSHRPFQGWRYFEPKEAPPDARAYKRGKGLTEALCAELAELGLL
ncbi:MAG TPA: DUF1489 domain-containing protein [Rhizomicrobium sp.]